MHDDFLRQASTWGRVFEIAVQRGALAQLIHQGLLPQSHPVLKDWSSHKVSDITKGVIQTLGITDTNAREWAETGIRHLLVFGYGLGWSTLREYLRHSTSRRLQLKAIWCPLTLPGAKANPEEEREETAAAFANAFHLQGPTDLALVQRGYPGRADFLLWLSSNKASRRKPERSKDFLLCLEFSYNAPPKLADFRTEEPHCEEIHRYARYIDSRGVFSRVCAEVEGEGLAISDQLANHLSAFSGTDKPLYKLCQASSYTERLVRTLAQQEHLPNGCDARAIAVTSNGLESLAAHFWGWEPESDPRARLMASMGEAYRNARKLADDAPGDLDNEIKLVFNKLINSLPTEFKKQAKQLAKNPDLGRSLDFRIQEQVKDFCTPIDLLSVDKAIDSLQSTEALTDFFGGDPRPYLLDALSQRATADGNISLRNAHAAAVVAGLNTAQPGRLNVIALEGNPGIGKTTAVTQFLAQQEEGYCFLYVSPRVVINRDVTNKLARTPDGKPSGILTMTSNAKLIEAARDWHNKVASSDGVSQRRQVDSAVVVDGIADLNHPVCSTIFVTPEDEQRIDTDIVTSKRFKRARNEREDSVQSHIRPGVLKTLAASARRLLEANSTVNRLVMTAAIQGYRAVQGGSTIDALGKLFAQRADSQAGKQERRGFAQKIPTIIAMVDEVAGDGAGALFCHKLAEWLTQQFIAPFEGESCPFRVVLIISDASLSNEVVLNSYLNSGESAPDKVLISPTAGDAAFRVTGTLMRVGTGRHPTLHVMTNSYPASQLNIDYSIRLASITPQLTSDGQLQSIRQAVREQSSEELLKNAQAEIEEGLKQNAEQIIFFAQDKAFLRQLRSNLISGNKVVLTQEEVKIIDQSVAEAERLKLVQEPLRDQVRVFLMTSSGARGISFPKTDWIIASIPRFNIESALMEVAQLIYRGRGTYTDPETGEQVSGDAKARRLVMLVNDFLIRDEAADQSRRWLRQSSDLLTLLLMLRSTIHTRIKGDAGLRKQRLAFVPVGFVGDEELLNLMSDDLRAFLNEARVFICDDNGSEDKGMVKKAAELVEQLFAHFNLIGYSPEMDASSYIDYDSIEALAKSVSRPTSRLLAIPVQDSQEALSIPDTATCLGPFWIESWKGRTSMEKFSFETWQRDVRDSSQNLLGLLKAITENSRISQKLRRPSNDLYKFLVRQRDASAREYSTIQDTQTDNIVIALPLDYPHFWRKQTGPEYRQKEIEDPATWRDALGRALTARGTVMPVVPKYQDFPWSAVVGKRFVSQVEVIFDNRYFMASSELNLLNTLLLENEESKS